jgi:hypothetical protein
MQQLASQGVNDGHAIINRMMGYVPDLHKIWVGTNDDQLMALSNEFPGFYRYAITMEEASEVERNKVSRPYDGMAQLSEQQKQMAAQLLTTAGTLERGYQAFLGSGNLQVFQPQVKEMDKLHQQWIADLETFRGVPRTQSIDPKTLVAVNEVIQRLADRIKTLAN